MYDFPTLLCCLNYANLYCLEITCLIISIFNFPLNLLGILNIKWNFIAFYCQILYSFNLAIITFSVFMIIFILLSTISKRILLNNYYKSFSKISLLNAFLFIFLVLSFSVCALNILNNYYKIKNKKYDFRNFKKFEKKRILDLIKSKKYWVKLYIATLAPIFFSFLNALIWLSIYYRISFRIYCSFNYEIRNELRKQKKSDMRKLEEETTNDKINNKKKFENIEASVVFEKNRHPYSKNIVKILDLKKNINFKLNFNNVDQFKEGFNVESTSSKREFNKSNNNM